MNHEKLREFFRERKPGIIKSAIVEERSSRERRVIYGPMQREAQKRFKVIAFLEDAKK